MRIDAYNAVNRIYNVNKSGKVNTVKKTGEKKDTVEISETARSFQAVKAAVAAAPDVRTDRVADLKAAYEAGTYAVAAGDIAAKLVEEF